MYQSLDDSFSYMVSPGLPEFVGTLDPRPRHRADHGRHQGHDPARFPVAPRRRFRFRSRHSLRANKTSWARIRTYFLKDENPDINRTSQVRPEISEGRYRVSLQSRSILTEDIYAIANITKLSDEFLLQDFFQSEFQLNPQPDNIVAVDENKSQLHAHRDRPIPGQRFFEMTERLPEVVLDVNACRSLADRFSTRGNRDRRAASKLPKGSMIPRLPRAADRFVPSVYLSKDLLRVALGRPAGRIPRHLLRRDARSRQNDHLRE